MTALIISAAGLCFAIPLAGVCFKVWLSSNPADQVRLDGYANDWARAKAQRPQTSRHRGSRL